MKVFPSVGLLNCEPLLSVTLFIVTTTSFKLTCSPTLNVVFSGSAELLSYGKFIKVLNPDWVK